MARPQETFNKKELEKRRVQKKKEKEQRKEERKSQAKDGQSWETMIAYVDENGNISSTPPDPTRKRDVKTEDIVTGSRNTGGQEPTIRTGKVSFFNTSKGFGFIKDSTSGESLFVHMSSLLVPVKENDNVTFDVERGPKGYSAVRVKKI
jgi:cold shock CspA family protein